MATSACSAWLSSFLTSSQIPASTHAWLMEPVRIYAAPMLKAAEADSGVAMPPPSPTHSGLWKLYVAMASFFRAMNVGKSVRAGRLSVCPPESASAVRSWAMGMWAASIASSEVIICRSTNCSSSFSGGGAKNCRATSMRDTFAITRFGVTMSPWLFRWMPLTR